MSTKLPLNSTKVLTKLEGGGRPSETLAAGIRGKTLRGMGGVGKTTLVAIFLRRVPEVCACFARICWVSFGQEPNLPELQRALYRELTGGATLADSVTEPEAVMEALRGAARGQRAGPREEARRGRLGCWMGMAVPLGLLAAGPTGPPPPRGRHPLVAPRDPGRRAPGAPGPGARNTR